MYSIIYIYIYILRIEYESSIKVVLNDKYLKTVLVVMSIYECVSLLYYIPSIMFVAWVATARVAMS